MAAGAPCAKRRSARQYPGAPARARAGAAERHNHHPEKEEDGNPAAQHQRQARRRKRPRTEQKDLFCISLAPRARQPQTAGRAGRRGFIRLVAKPQANYTKYSFLLDSGRYTRAAARPAPKPRRSGFPRRVGRSPHWGRRGRTRPAGTQQAKRGERARAQPPRASTAAASRPSRAPQARGRGRERRARPYAKTMTEIFHKKQKPYTALSQPCRAPAVIGHL